MHIFLLKGKLATRNSRKLLTLASALLLSSISFANSWYVNDGSTSGDVFTTAVGNNGNAGTPAAPFLTVQFAIGAASAGDTIYVDAGTYTDGDININKSLVLRGAKWGIHAGPEANPVGRGTDESIIAGGSGIYFAQSTDNITVDGFYIDLGNGIRGIEARGLNSTVVNNMVAGTVNLLIQQAGISTRANAPSRVHSYHVQYNNVKDCRNDFFFDGAQENISEFSYNYASGAFTAGFQITLSNGHLFLANVSENNNYGLIVNKGSTTIERNTFNANNIAGVRLAGTANTSNNSIQFNYFTNNFTGIALTDDHPAAVNNSAHYNSFGLNGQNITNDHAASFNATCNWYGTTVQALINLTIGGAGSTTFVPFLTDGTDTDPVVEGFQPDQANCIVLPVKLTSFTAVPKNYDVLLNWQTEQEINSSHFIVERSTNGFSFTSIGRVEAKGTSDTRVAYHFTDNKPVIFDRPVYYRLRSVDKDGSFQYSRIVYVVLKTAGSHVQNVYPNPAKAGSIVTADFIAPVNGTITLWIVNAIGQTISTTNLQVVKGSNKIKVQLPASSGIHYLLFQDNENTQKVPLVIE